MKIYLSSDVLKFNPYQEKNQNKIEKPMTCEVENPTPGLEQAQIVWIWLCFVVFKATFNNMSQLNGRLLSVVFALSICDCLFGIL